MLWKRYIWMWGFLPFLHSCKQEVPVEFLSELQSASEFATLAEGSNENGGNKSVKVLIDINADKIYYISSSIFPSHYEFAVEHLGYEGDKWVFFTEQYGTSPNRFLHLINLTYYASLDLYAFSFGPYDLVDCAGIQATYALLKATSFLQTELVFFPNNLKWESCSSLPQISAAALMEGYQFQTMNAGECYGYLRFISFKDLSSASAGPDDIIVLNGLPIDMPLVAGTITTGLQNSLSHINILSRNRGTPNLVLPTAWDDPDLRALEGKPVHFTASLHGYQIEKAELEEMLAFRNTRKKGEVIHLEADNSLRQLLEVSEHTLCTVDRAGGKAANFAMLHAMGDIPLPEDPFIIPFAWYQEHMQRNGIQDMLEIMFQDESFNRDSDFRRKELAKIRKAIQEAPLNTELLELVSERLGDFKDYPSYRFRSSTNAEDLDYFSGAGLYGSYSARKGDAQKTIDNAIRKVWASLWNERAVDERSFFNIDPFTVEMGILVHRSFPDEAANGVLITHNPYNVNPGLLVQVQAGETPLVVAGKASVDEVIMYTLDLAENRYTLEYRSRSSLMPKGQTVMTNAELFQLADLARNIHKRFLQVYRPAEPAKFAVDIEFKIDIVNGKRVLYIKQARPWPASVF